MPKQKVFSRQQQEAIRKQAIDFWEKSTEFMDPFFRGVNDYFRLWRCLIPKELEDAYKSHPDRSALCPADVYLNINSLKAHIYSVMFGSKPYASLTAEGLPNLRSVEVEKAAANRDHARPAV